MGRPKLYTREELKERQKEQYKARVAENPKEHRKKHNARMKKWRKTHGRDRERIWFWKRRIKEFIKYIEDMDSDMFPMTRDNVLYELREHLNAK